MAQPLLTHIDTLSMAALSALSASIAVSHATSYARIVSVAIFIAMY